ncbi:hypothetical protein V0288_07210 [Pannus brasiliensis CCIBt3594]|uniref:Uncharacterized protein n=1 Tax=Pannus brasiliensis CCIBt3594 TaxID=1427578 RepID=A0AAW9QW43_9CHRO
METLFAPRSNRSIEREKDPELFGRSLLEGGFAFQSYGARVGIRADRVDVLRRALDYLPPGIQELTSPEFDELYSFSCPSDHRQNYRLFCRDIEIARTGSLAELLDIFDTDLRIKIGLLSPEYLFVHAGAIGWKGRAIVIPGRSFSGKTTLVTALVKAGAIYYSDEYAVFDRQGLVHPYARELSIRKGENERVKCSVEKLGGESGVEPLPVGLVVHTKYGAGHSWNSREISPGQAVLALLENTIAARTRSSFALSTLARSVSRARAIEGERGEAEEGAAAILQQIENIFDLE